MHTDTLSSSDLVYAQKMLSRFFCYVSGTGFISWLKARYLTLRLRFRAMR